MTRLIDADAYEHAVQGNPYVSDSVKRYVRCSIQSQPTIDAEPVRHGKWMPREEGKVYPFWERYTCSECGEHSDDKRYCPNCGARMDEE